MRYPRRLSTCPPVLSTSPRRIPQCTAAESDPADGLKPFHFALLASMSCSLASFRCSSHEKTKPRTLRPILAAWVAAETCSGLNLRTGHPFELLLRREF